jgi:NADPH:quinone reductase-like Zn-dependent oxidoreductase
MKAMVYTKYGSPDVLQLKEVEKPTPGDHEVLIKVQAVSLNAADWHMLTADIFPVRLMSGLFAPHKPILGLDIAGKVEAVGSGVNQFKAGDEVFGDISFRGSGGLAEYATAPESFLVLKPANLTFEQAAAVPVAAVTALQGLRDLGRIQAGQKILINGASGGVGTFAVQLAKAFGAEVTAVCSARNMNQARSLGAEHVIDYGRTDFTQNGQQYDLILGVNGYHPIAAYRRALAPEGIYVMTGGKPAQLFQALLLGPLFSQKGGRKLCSLSAQPSQKDLVFLKEWLETGMLTPVIDRVFPFVETPDAFRYLGTGHARGKVVITGAA